MTTERLLREYVRAVLLAEDEGGVGDGYGDLYATAAGMSPYGMHFGSGKDLYNVFVKPFTDVISTAAGKTKELSQQGLTTLKVAFEAVATSLIPVLRDSYTEVFAKEKQEIEKIRSEYSDVYQSNWDAFKDHDVMVAAFMYSPVGFLTQQFAEKSPKVTAKLLSVLSGGELDDWLKKVEHRFGWDKQSKANADAHGAGPWEGVVREESGDPEKQQPSTSVGAVLTNKKVLEKVAGSQKVKQMERVGKAMVRNTLQQVYKQASGVLKANNLQDLQNKTGAKLKGLDKIQQVPEKERQKAEQELLLGAKKSLREFYLKNLEAQVKEATDAGVPAEHPYVHDYQAVISKIKAL